MVMVKNKKSDTFLKIKQFLFVATPLLLGMVAVILGSRAGSTADIECTENPALLTLMWIAGVAGVLAALFLVIKSVREKSKMSILLSVLITPTTIVLVLYALFAAYFCFPDF